MKRILWICLLLFCLFLLGGCSGSVPVKEEGTFLVTTDLFPVYDWTREIIGDAEGIELRFLCDDGTDMHSFQPTADDLIGLLESDLVIYVNGESEEWLSEVLENGQAEERSLTLLDTLGDRLHEEEASEGMEVREEDEEEEVYDEHIWLSLLNAEVCCEAICHRLSELLPEQADIFNKNLENYLRKLMELEQSFRGGLEALDKRTLVFADRFPFLYLTKDYDLTYYAAFPGCSAESEASFKTVLFLADKCNELNLSAMLVIDGSNEKVASTVKKASGREDLKILTLDSLQAVSMEHVEAGITYISVMEKNLGVLKEALQ